MLSGAVALYARYLVVGLEKRLINIENATATEAELVVGMVDHLQTLQARVDAMSVANDQGKHTNDIIEMKSDIEDLKVYTAALMRIFVKTIPPDVLSSRDAKFLQNMGKSRSRRAQIKEKPKKKKPKKEESSDEESSEDEDDSDDESSESSEEEQPKKKKSKKKDDKKKKRDRRDSTGHEETTDMMKLKELLRT